MAATDLRRSADHLLTIDTVIHRRRVVVRLRGDVDRTNADRVEAAVVEAVRMSPWTDVDMTGVGFIDSFGLRALLRARATAGRHDEITVVAASRPVARVLVMTGLDGVFGLDVSFS